ncbi:MAG: hypothetical protein HC902_10815 [Calothrix sp. SM1_5_4]|nr:hypothetical protein [Calothrix sp. SM1_5_4]
MLTLLFFLTTFVHAETYEGLAAVNVPAHWARFSEALEKFDEASMPENAKPVRHALASLRDQIELFSYAYPGKRWKKIQESLDEGYLHLGEYKDLLDFKDLPDGADPTYDPKELARERKDVLKWKAEFKEDADKNLAYLSRPSPEFTYRNKKDLSRFFWGGVGAEPDPRLNAEENFTLLADELLALAADDFPEVKKIKDPAESEEKAERFHDFRKRTRAFGRILKHLPFLASTMTSEDIRLLGETQERYGNINDRVTAALHFHERGEKKDEARARADVLRLWTELLAWQDTIDVPGLLGRLRRALPGPEQR